jgi:hypothetical protein
MGNANELRLASPVAHEQKFSGSLVATSQHFTTPARCRIVSHREESHGEREI